MDLMYITAVLNGMNVSQTERAHTRQTMTEIEALQELAGKKVDFQRKCSLAEARYTQIAGSVTEIEAMKGEIGQLKDEIVQLKSEISNMVQQSEYILKCNELIASDVELTQVKVALTKVKQENTQLRNQISTACPPAAVSAGGIVRPPDQLLSALMVAFDTKQSIVDFLMRELQTIHAMSHISITDTNVKTIVDNFKSRLVEHITLFLYKKFEAFWMIYRINESSEIPDLANQQKLIQIGKLPVYRIFFKLLCGDINICLASIILDQAGTLNLKHVFNNNLSIFDVWLSRLIDRDTINFIRNLCSALMPVSNDTMKLIEDIVPACCGTSFPLCKQKTNPVDFSFESSNDVAITCSLKKQIEFSFESVVCDMTRCLHPMYVLAFLLIPTTGDDMKNVKTVEFDVILKIFGIIMQLMKTIPTTLHNLVQASPVVNDIRTKKIIPHVIDTSIQHMTLSRDVLKGISMPIYFYMIHKHMIDDLKLKKIQDCTHYDQVISDIDTRISTAAAAP